MTWTHTTRLSHFYKSMLIRCIHLEALPKSALFLTQWQCYIIIHKTISLTRTISDAWFYTLLKFISQKISKCFGGYLSNKNLIFSKFYMSFLNRYAPHDGVFRFFLVNYFLPGISLFWELPLKRKYLPGERYPNKNS